MFWALELMRGQFRVVVMDAHQVKFQHTLAEHMVSKLVGARVVTLGCGGITVVPFCDVLRHNILTHNLQDFLVPDAILHSQFHV